MKKRTLFPLLFFILFITHSQAQEVDYTSYTIPQNLRENSNAVIKNHSTEILIDDINRMTIKERKVITILNKVGHENYSDTYAMYDNDTKIKKINARVYNAFGKEIKKFNKGKFTDVSAVGGGTLYDDSRVMYIEYTPISYPYTLEFEVEYETKSTGFIPRWNPIRSYYLGIEKSQYRLINTTDSEIRFKEKNFEGYEVKRSDLENGFEYTLESQEPIKYESSSFGLRNLTPELMVAMTNFSLKGVNGTGDNWKDFGKWMYDKLLLGRTTLEASTKAKVLELTKGTDDPIEKAKIIYKFMQNKTRYISVQVGIGGWEPIAANQVDKVGYGDCKGLTNYMKALLDVIGVESYYTVVYADNQVDIEKDFASMQGTHVILNLPNNGKDIWLECTSQSVPFGFIGTFTDDRLVMVVTPEGGIIKRTSSYLNEQNLQTIKSKIELDAEGNVKATLKRNSIGTQYDDKYYLVDLPDSELKKHYKTKVWSYHNNLEVKSLQVKNDKDSILYKEDLDIEISGYASISQNDYLFRVNIFNRDTYVPKRYRNRKLPLRVSRGYKDVDEYIFKIPEGYTIEMLPQDKIIESKFGDYQVMFRKVDATTFTYSKSILIKAGEYPKEDYNLYRKFRKSIAKYENIRISLTKKP